jgi:hypothetical protein
VDSFLDVGVREKAVIVERDGPGDNAFTKICIPQRRWRVTAE